MKNFTEENPVLLREKAALFYAQRMKNAQHYKDKGARAYAIGIARFPIAPHRGWQQAAERAGYQEARAKWKAENPGADEWAAASERNRAFCQFATKG